MTIDRRDSGCLPVVVPREQEQRAIPYNLAGIANKRCRLGGRGATLFLHTPSLQCELNNPALPVADLFDVPRSQSGQFLLYQ